jgi:TonB family protein
VTRNDLRACVDATDDDDSPPDMKRPGSSFVIPACLSAAVHVTLLTVLPRYFSTGPGGNSTQDLPVATIARLPDPQEEPVLPEAEIGDRQGKGYATAEVDAPTQAKAPEADADQAYLGLNPPGVDKSGRGSGIAEMAGEDGSGGSSGGATPRQAQRSVAPFGVNSELKLPKPSKARPPQEPTAVADAGGAIFGPSAAPVVDPTDAPPLPALNSPTTQPSDAAQLALVPQPQPAPASADARAPGSSSHGEPLPTGSPSRMSDSESDPFSRLGTVTFSDGAMEIQFGRKVKTRKPKILLAGKLDLLTLRRARVILDVDIDETGKVMTVNVDKSSGSNDIDQPTRVAVYDWWFEPKLDQSGKPVPDRVQFTINWR